MGRLGLLWRWLGFRVRWLGRFLSWFGLLLCRRHPGIGRRLRSLIGLCAGKSPERGSGRRGRYRVLARRIGGLLRAGQCRGCRGRLRLRRRGGPPGSGGRWCGGRAARCRRGHGPHRRRRDRRSARDSSGRCGIRGIAVNAEDGAADGTARPHPGLRNLGRVDPIHGGAVGTRNIHGYILIAAHVRGPCRPHRCHPGAGRPRTPTRARSSRSSSSPWPVR